MLFPVKIISQGCSAGGKKKKKISENAYNIGFLRLLALSPHGEEVVCSIPKKGSQARSLPVWTVVCWFLLCLRGSLLLQPPPTVQTHPC